jgi:hypothetical protein
MNLNTVRPRLRVLDFKPVEFERTHYLMLRDPLALSGRDLFVPEPLLPVLPYLDGSRDLKTIRFSLIVRHGLSLSPDRLDELVLALDEACLLENENYFSARAHALQTYRSASCRPAHMAGEGYPADPDELTASLEQYLAAEGLSLDGPSRQDYRGLICPHIDYPRGGAVYARLWSAAAASARQAELAILIGTDHFSEGFPISLTQQPYATPYGELPIPTDLLANLVAILGEETAFAGELHHYSEHSIELASVWLHFARQGATLPVLPILIGPLDTLPEAKLSAVVSTLQRVSRRKHTLVIAAGDLAHVGPAFNGPPVTAADLDLLRRDDETILMALNGQSDETLKTTLNLYTANNVCGSWPIYLAARILGSIRVEPLAYAACPADEQNTSFVSIAGVGLV